MKFQPLTNFVCLKKWLHIIKIERQI